MKERFQLIGLVLLGVFIGLPLFFLAHVIWWALTVLRVLDLPVWLFFGKTPIGYCADKLHTELLLL